MKPGTEGKVRFLLHLALLPIVGIALAQQAFPQSRGPEPARSLTARDLYIVRGDPPPGLKCRVLMRDAAGEYTAIRPDAAFHSHDHIRLEFESNVPGYLYLIQEGSGSTWSVLFPSAQIRDNDNRLQPQRPLEFPRGTAFVFDDTPGQEKVYAVFTLKPEPDLERLLGVVRTGQRAGQEEAALPELSQQISSTVNSEVRSRDLKVGTESDGDQPATYAVNTAPAPLRVVLEIALNHQK